MSSITPLSPSLSKRLKKLRVKHIMNWEELEQQTMHDSWMYKAVIMFDNALKVLTDIIASIIMLMIYLLARLAMKVLP